MQTLRETIAEYAAAGKALGHFNFSDSNQLQAIASAAKESGLPVVVGLSEGEREFFPLAQARALVEYYNAGGAQIYLNADHTYSIEKVQQALTDHVDSVVVDGAKLPFEENVMFAGAAVKYAKAAGRDILIEGELGYIGSGSEVHDALPEGAAVTDAMMTNVEDLQKFVTETSVDLIAPAVGNIHGIVTSGQPKLSIERIQALAHATSVPLVLHGGSGSSDEEFTQAIHAGIVMIHINTDLRVLYKNTLVESLQSVSDVAPYKFLVPAVQAMQQYVAQKIRLFAKV